MSEVRNDLTRLTLAVLFIATLIGTCVWILQPFLPAVVWAAMLVISTWALMRRVQGWLWNKRWLAVTVMTVSILILFVVPFWLAIGTIAGYSGEVVEWADSLSSAELRQPPGWLKDVPLIGPALERAWVRVGDTGARDLLAKARPYAGSVMRWF